jgi:hypothetical protein
MRVVEFKTPNIMSKDHLTQELKFLREASIMDCITICNISIEAQAGYLSLNFLFS